jgi:hypothetical protein
MNASAKAHLAKAKDYLAKGDEFYRKAKPEIDKAKAEGAHVDEISRYLEKSPAWVYNVLAWNGEGTLYGNDTARRQADMAKQVLREATPEQTAELVASLPQEAVENIAKAVSRNYEQRGEEAKRKSEQDFREAVGDDLADDLAEEQRLRDAEMKVFEARRALRDSLALLNDSNLDAIPDAWREDFLKTLDDLAMRVDLHRSLLTGTLDEDIAQFLSEV